MDSHNGTTCCKNILLERKKFSSIDRCLLSVFVSCGTLSSKPRTEPGRRDGQALLRNLVSHRIFVIGQVYGELREQIATGPAMLQRQRRISCAMDDQH